jgi:hypothetical protein
VLAGISLDHGIPPVEARGGSTAAQALLRNFLIRSAGRILGFSSVPMSREPHFWHFHLFPLECVFSDEQPLYRLTKLPVDVQ